MEDFQQSQTIALGPADDGDNVHGNGTGGDYSLMIEAPADAILMDGIDVNQALEAPTDQKIPLICSICPKNTKFSDVSHLLTHIASKGHLSNMFKLDIAKYTDDEARERLEEYQAWFDDHNIRELLQSRSENRIQKETGGRGRGGSQVGITPIRHRYGQGLSRTRIDPIRGTTKRGKRGQRDRDNSQSTTHTASIKCELEDDLESMSDLNSSSNAYTQQPWNQIHGGQEWSNLPIWNGFYYEPSFQQELSFGNGQPHPADEADEVKGIETPSRYEPSDAEEEGDSSYLHSEDTVDTTLHEQDHHAAPGVLDDEEREHIHFRKYLKGEISRLEGVGGFDAAPEAQRRKRNQKKDPSVLVHMEASSRAVRTFEQVTDLNFNHLRWRDVYDEPSINGSEDEADELNPAKRSQRRSPKKTRGRSGRPRGIKVEDTTSRESSVTSTTRGSRRGRATRTTRQASTQFATSRTTSTHGSSQASNPITRSSRSKQANTSSVSSQGPPGHIRVSNRVVDVFRDNVDPLPGSNGDHANERRQNNLPGLALRPGNVNHSLLSPTPMVKNHASTVRLLAGKVNSHTSFPASSATSNPYLSNPDSIGDSSFNPLCIQTHASPEARGYSLWEENMEPLSAGFQPINSHQGFDSLHLSSHDNEGYRTTQHQQGGLYDI